MGVTNLLPQLKDIQREVSLTEYKGKTLAVDGYGWLHRGLILCAQDLCLDRPTQSYITSFMKKIQMLRDFQVDAYVVFDGASLPTKEMTANERREKRKVAREAANKYLKAGNKGAAFKEFMKAAAVTPEMAKAIMVELDRLRVKYVVAPYEADPQMVYLEKVGLVDGILSEDSDLLIFGCKKLITKLNDRGTCIEIDKGNLHKLKADYHRFTNEQWRSLAILSGCDYTKGIPGVGMKTAYNLIVKNGSWEAICVLLAGEKKTISEQYRQEAFKANLAFQFSKVFDPLNSCITTLNEYPPDFDIDMELVELCCGRGQLPEVQAGICLGKLHPYGHHPLLSRETLVKTGLLNAPTLKKPVVSASSACTIDSFFNVKATGSLPKELQLQKSVKNSFDRSVKLSPNAKKLKRLEPHNVNTAPVSSKFFSSAQPRLVPLEKDLVNVQLRQRPPPPPSLLFETAFEAQSSFLTGESEIPDESSSPIKEAPGDSVLNYLTDDDENDSCLSAPNSMVSTGQPTNSSTLTKSSECLHSELDDGYENELEESPIKFEKVTKSWRSQFLMKESAELVSATASQASKNSSKLNYLKAKKNIEDTNAFKTSTVSVMSVEKTLVSQECLQPSQLSESDDELSIMKRAEPKTLSFGLLRFSFTG